MGTIQEAVQVLRRAEQSLRDLLAKTAANGRYDDLIRLGDLAREVATLVTKAEDFGPAGNPLDVSVGALRAAKSLSTAPGSPSPRRNELKKRSYPKFLRDSETIIKIGWSKTAKAEYEHKAPKRVLIHLVATLGKFAATKKRVTMDDVLPLKDPVIGSEVPTYQAYLCLAWLRAMGVVARHGRRGYSLARIDGVDARVEECWRRLAVR